MSEFTRRQVIDYIGGLKVIELPDFIEELKDVLKIKEVAYAAPAAGKTEAAEVAEEKTEFELYLVTAGSDKVGTIKAVRKYQLSWSLMDTKKNIEEATGPIFIKKGNKEEIAKAKVDFDAVGATVEVK